VITTWIITIVTFLLGFGLGFYVKNTEEVEQKIRRIKARKKIKLGPVDNISAEEVYKEKSGLKEEEEEFDKVLKDVL